MLLWLGLDAIDRLPFQAGRLRYRGYGNSLAQEFSNQRELVPSECWLASPIFRPVVMFLGMRDARFLRFLAGFRLGLSRRCHKGDQGVADSLLHRILRRAVEVQSIDDRANDDAPADEFSDGVSYVGVVSP